MTVRVVELPSTSNPDADLRDDVHSVLLATKELEGSAITALGHSYGGAVLRAAASGIPNLVHAIFLAALVPRGGESATDASRRIRQRTLLDEAITLDGPWLRLSAPLAAEALAGDATTEQQERLVDSLRPQSRQSFLQPVPASQWEGRVSYVACARDQALSYELQCAQVPVGATQIDLESDHCPMVSHPRELAAILGKLMTPVETTESVLLL
jgi:pimeloyl-ACP methyl ester carboxylesterase